MICYLCFLVHLRVANRCESMLNVQVDIGILEDSIIELLAIIGDDGVGKPESTDN